MQFAPYDYDYINSNTAIMTPSTVHITGTSLATFFRRYLLQKAMSVFKWQIPENWDLSYFLYSLYTLGFVAIIDTDKFGVIPQHCSLMGYDVFYRPQRVVVVNPLIERTLDPIINKECALLKLQPNYNGIMDLVTTYGDMMALVFDGIGVNILNSKLAYVFTASNKAEAESLKKLFDRIASGEPAAFVDSHINPRTGERSWDAFTQNVGQNFITPQMLDALDVLEQQFDTRIGIPNSNTNKRERLVVDEVNSNNTETMLMVDMWLEELQKGCAIANELFPGLDMWVDWRVQPETDTLYMEEGGENGEE